MKISERWAFWEIGNILRYTSNSKHTFFSSYSATKTRTASFYKSNLINFKTSVSFYIDQQQIQKRWRVCNLGQLVLFFWNAECMILFWGSNLSIFEEHSSALFKTIGKAATLLGILSLCNCILSKVWSPSAGDAHLFEATCSEAAKYTHVKKCLHCNRKFIGKKRKTHF